jgi:parallel beta-helix repeat protein
MKAVLMTIRSLVMVILAIIVTITPGVLVQCHGVQGAVSPWTILKTHSPIIVDNEGELSSLFANERWDGSGTAEDPYVVKNLEINAKGEGDCISIGNTSAYLIIQDCRLYGSEPTSFGVPGSAAISVNNVENAVIRNNELNDNTISIELVETKNTTIENNTCDRSTIYSVSLENCTEIQVVKNECTNNSQHSIEVYLSTECLIENNTCNDNEYMGIQVDGGGNNTIRNNTCKANGMFGIVLYATEHNLIEHNLCEANGHFGINLEYSNSNRIVGNSLLNNDGADAVYDPHHGQAQDLSGNNTWNNSTAGNYWSDWYGPDADGNGIVDSPYVINSGDSRDYYPLARARNDLNTFMLIAAVLAIVLLSLIGILLSRKWRRSP